MVSRVRIVAGDPDAVERQYRERVGHVDRADGFLGMEVLRDQDDRASFWVQVRFRDRAAYERYRTSDAFRDAHARLALQDEKIRIDPDVYAVHVLDVVAR
jgi:heme-degrading monooxygenase HmoA